MVDGEKVKINLKEHMNVIAGELTVQSRLGKVSSFREEVEQRRKGMEAEYSSWTGDVKKVLDYAAKGYPDAAIYLLAEAQGLSPVQMEKALLRSLVAKAKKLEGKSEAEIENHYHILEQKWREKKDEKVRTQTEKQKKASQFASLVTSELRRENISQDDFVAATREMMNGGYLEGLDQEARLGRVIEHALVVKHHGMAAKALQTVDPKLAGNKKVLKLLLESTHPNKFTVEEMADVVREFLGKTTARIASSLSKKARLTPPRSEKQNEAGKNKKAFTSQQDLAKAFGF